ncbi:MAG: hypothetical protein U5Q03_09480 [Bacteroidota bacterium]|nr:hypothetical protein [Bacteroidota bacterium]
MILNYRKKKLGAFAKIGFVVGMFFLLLSTATYSQVQLGEDLIDIDYSNPRDYEVGGITVSGVKYLDPNVLIMLSGLSVGDEIQIPGKRSRMLSATSGNKVFSKISMCQWLAGVATVFS